MYHVSGSMTTCCIKACVCLSPLWLIHVSKIATPFSCPHNHMILYSRCVQDLFQKSACRSEMSRLYKWACLYVYSACHLIASIITRLKTCQEIFIDTPDQRSCFAQKSKASSRLSCEHIWETQCTAGLAIAAFVPSKLHACCYPELKHNSKQCHITMLLHPLNCWMPSTRTYAHELLKITKHMIMEFQTLRTPCTTKR